MTGRILIADAVPTNRIVLRVKLTTAYYGVLQAGSAAEALLAVRRQQPDLVIASAELPDMAGDAFCRQLRAIPGAAETPVILVSSDPAPEARLTLLAAGADDVLSRPVDELVLLARLRSLLRARHAADELRLREDTRRALGLAEQPSEFQSPARIALVSPGAQAELATAAVALRARLRDRIEVMTPEEALRPTRVAPEVFVIADGASGNGEGLDLLSQLRASPALRQSAIVYVASPGDRRTAASALDLGASDLMTGGLDPAELAIRLPRQIARKRTTDRLRANMRDGLRAAVTDPLTGLYNRRYALPHLARLAEHGCQQRRCYAVLLADLDHFKQVNDHHGHAAGDAVLIEVARRLSENLRAADLVSRIGGEEFLIAMPNTGGEAAEQTAERLRRIVADTPVTLPGPGGESIAITMSIGLTLPDPTRAETPETLLDRADRALYAAKHAGRNRVACDRDAEAPQHPPTAAAGGL